MTKTNDGFEIARFDLESRGPGDFFGQRQHGDLHFKFTDGTNLEALTDIKAQAEALLARDPQLSLPEHRTLRLKLGDLFHAADMAAT